MYAICFFALRADATDNADSLRAVVNNPEIHDTVRFQALHRLAWNVHIFNAPDSAMHYALLQLDIAKNRGDLRMLSSAYNNLAVSRHVKGQLEDALPFYLLGLATDDSLAARNPNDLKILKGVAVSNANVGILYQQIGDLRRAVDAYMKALKLYEQIDLAGQDSRSGIADVTNSLGLANVDLGQYDEAERWFTMSIEVIGDEASLQQKFASRTNLAKLYARVADDQADPTEKINYLTRSEESFRASLEFANEAGNKRNAAIALNNIGNILLIKATASNGENTVNDRDFTEALNVLRKAEQLSREVDDPGNLALALRNQAEVLLELKQYNEAYRLAQKALQSVYASDELSKISAVNELNYRVAKALRRNDEALVYFEEHIAMRDSIRKEDSQREVMRQQFHYDYEKREALLKAEQEKQNALAVEALRRKSLQRNASFGAFALMLLLAAVFLRQRVRIAREKERSEHLLLNILPADTAEELKEKGTSEARLFEDVTVLFTDFKGFTQLSETLPPAELVAMINECFCAFDRITEVRGIEKIKTIGDAYMAAGGLPSPNHTHAADVVKAAIDIQAFMEEFKKRKQKENLPFFEIRIGVHTGPLVAGIVGIKKFQYDIWGDTVNTAARMESSGEIGKVNISQSTFMAISHLFTCAYRGEIEAKGKGLIGMYFVEKPL